MISLSKYARENWKDKHKLIKMLTKNWFLNWASQVTELWTKNWFEIWNYMWKQFIKVISEEVLVSALENDWKNLQKEEVVQETVTTKTTTKTIRTQFKADYRTNDWHFVRSRAEVMIDDWLYNNEVVHAYERKLPVEEELYSDFYLPTWKVYIEFWWYEDDEKYLDRKKKKQEIYKKYNINLIELSNKDIESLDDILPKKLLQFWITIY